MDDSENHLLDVQLPFILKELSSALASDTSRTVDAVVHARDELLAAGRYYDVLVLL